MEGNGRWLRRPGGSDAGTPAGVVSRGTGARPEVDAAARGNQRRFQVLWAALVLVILAGLALSATTRHQSGIDASRRAVSDAAMMVRHHLQRHLEATDLILRHAAREVVDHGWNAMSRPGARTGVAALPADSAGWITGFWLTDAEGALRFADAPPGPALLPAVLEAHNRALAAPHRMAVGRPAATAADAGRSVFTVARAIVGSDGTVLGSAVVAVSGDDLAGSFSREALGVNGSVALVRTDGLLLARHPSSAMVGEVIPPESPAIRALTQGAERVELEAVSPVDGRNRFVAFVRFDLLPMAAMASRSAADVRAEVLEHLRPQLLLGALLIAVLAVLYPVMMRRLHSERRAARELVERELLFRSVLNNVGIGLSLVGADGTIRYANAGFDRLLGYEPGSLTGRNLEDLTHPDDRLSTMYRVSRMEALGPTGLSYENRYLTRDGDVLEAMVTLSLKPRMGDQEPLLVGVVQDLTDLRSREKAIAFRNSLLRIQQEASPDGILVADADGRLRSWNRRFRDIWSVPAALLEQGDVPAVLRHIDGAARDGGTVVDAAGTDRPEAAEDAGWLRRHLSDGGVVDTLKCVLHDRDGTFIGTVWFFRDVSRQLASEAAVRESEARYRALVEQSPEAILVFRDMRVLFANRAAADLFGYGADAVGLVDRPLTDLVSPAVRDQVAETFRTAACTPWNGIQEELHGRDGTLFDAWIISAPVRVEDQPAAQAVIRPLDAGQGVRGRLMQTAKMATLGQMAANVAHELSQPLNILSMGLEGLLLRQAQGGVEPVQVTETVEMAVRQCSRMAEIIDHIRVFSRSGSARRTSFEAAGPLRAAAGMMAPVFQREGLMLDVDLPDRCGVVEGNPLDLEQVVINLLKNAFDALLDYRAAGGGAPGWVPAARVTARPEAGGRHLAVEVSDTGAGIPEELLPDIFEPFFTTKEEGVGTGLGLAICANTVARMGGVLRADNRDGAVLLMRLPLAGPGSDAGAAATGAAAGGVVLPMPGCHVMVAWADVAERRALAVVLVEHGFRVSTAATADEILGKARLDPPDAVVAAEDLPGSGDDDGVALLRRLRQRGLDQPVILLAQARQPADAAGPAASLPGVTVLERPVEGAAVVAAVAAAVSVRTDP